MSELKRLSSARLQLRFDGTVHGIRISIMHVQETDLKFCARKSGGATHIDHCDGGADSET